MMYLRCFKLNKTCKSKQTVEKEITNRNKNLKKIYETVTCDQAALFPSEKKKAPDRRLTKQWKKELCLSGKAEYLALKQQNYLAQQCIELKKKDRKN